LRAAIRCSGVDEQRRASRRRRHGPRKQLGRLPGGRGSSEVLTSDLFLPMNVNEKILDGKEKLRALSLSFSPSERERKWYRRLRGRRGNKRERCPGISFFTF
jgi:hypothetical protein